MGMELNQEKGREGSYGRGKRKLKKKGLLACLLASSLSPSFPPERLCLPSLTHSLGRLVAFALFKMPIPAPILPSFLSLPVSPSVTSAAVAATAL